MKSLLCTVILIQSTLCIKVYLGIHHIQYYIFDFILPDYFYIQIKSFFRLTFWTSSRCVIFQIKTLKFGLLKSTFICDVLTSLTFRSAYHVLTLKKSIQAKKMHNVTRIEDKYNISNTRRIKSFKCVLEWKSHVQRSIDKTVKETLPCNNHKTKGWK